VNVDFAFICDYAEAAGKINALGIGFDTIFAPRVPAIHPIFAFVMQLRANVVEAGTKRLEIHLIDEDGAEVIPPLRSNIEMKRPEAGTESVAKIALHFGHVKFPRYGQYSLRAVLDGNQVAAVALSVSPPSQQQ